MWWRHLSWFLCRKGSLVGCCWTPSSVSSFSNSVFCAVHSRSQFYNHFSSATSACWVWTGFLPSPLRLSRLLCRQCTQRDTSHRVFLCAEYPLRRCSMDQDSTLNLAGWFLFYIIRRWWRTATIYLSGSRSTISSRYGGVLYSSLRGFIMFLQFA